MSIRETKEYKRKQAESARKHYLANKEKVKQRAADFKKAKTAKHRKLASRYKLLCGCKICGYKKCSAALDFHHLRDKDEAVSKIINSGCGTEKVKNEIRKCEILCSNCHRELHSAE